LLKFEARGEVSPHFSLWNTKFAAKMKKGSRPARRRSGTYMLRCNWRGIAARAMREIFKKSSLHSYTVPLYIYASAAPDGAALISLAEIVQAD
jgi:hypothetical protein